MGARADVAPIWASIGDYEAPAPGRSARCHLNAPIPAVVVQKKGEVYSLRSSTVWGWYAIEIGDQMLNLGSPLFHAQAAWPGPLFFFFGGGGGG